LGRAPEPVVGQDLCVCERERERGEWRSKTDRQGKSAAGRRRRQTESDRQTQDLAKRITAVRETKLLVIADDRCAVLQGRSDVRERKSVGSGERERERGRESAKGPRGADHDAQRKHGHMGVAYRTWQLAQPEQHLSHSEREEDEKRMRRG
jgi:hypothetical protein